MKLIFHSVVFSALLVFKTIAQADTETFGISGPTSNFEGRFSLNVCPSGAAKIIVFPLNQPAIEFEFAIEEPRCRQLLQVIKNELLSVKETRYIYGPSPISSTDARIGVWLAVKDVQCAVTYNKGAPWASSGKFRNIIQAINKTLPDKFKFYSKK